MGRKLRQLIICHDTHPKYFNDNDEHPNNTNNINTEKAVISETMILSLMMSITGTQIITNSTTTVQTTTTSTTLIHRKMLIITSYVIIAKAVNFLISFKNMVHLRRMPLNLFNNTTQIYSKENSNTLISGQNNITLQFNITYVINAINI